MENINRDVIYLICKKLNLSSILKFSLVNKRMYEKVMLHPDIILDKLEKQGVLNSLKRCHFLSYQIKTTLRGMISKLEE